MAASTAWLLDLGSDTRAAVGERELIHLIERPQLHEIPGTPVHCRHVLIWQARIVPTMDIPVRLQGGRAEGRGEFVGIVAYQEKPGYPPGFGALLLDKPPSRISVDDDQACALPEQPVGWNQVSISCFSDDKGAVPILDLSRLFSGPPHK